MVERPAPMRELDWEPARARAFADKTADIWQELLERLPSMPVAGRWSAKQVHDAMAIPIPDEPMDDGALFAYLREMAFDWSTYCGHPRFMAYISGSGTAPGAAADLLAAGLNANLGGWRLSPSATEIELALTRWFAREVFGLPEGAGGMIASGGAMANFIALKAARDNRAGWNVRRLGVAGGPRLAMYLSSETHVVSARAADMLGIGTDQVRSIPVDGDYRIDVDALREAVEADRAAGVQPLAVVASAGTVATGAVDPLNEVADLCEAEGLWFHVDAAYGGPAMLAEDLRPMFAGIERADSIAFDPHKWLYTPHSGGCVLVRSMAHLKESFDVNPSYIHQDKEYTQSGIDLGLYGPQFSRGFWALKVWVSLLAHGRRAFGERISHDAALARYVAACAEERDDFEVCAPVTLSIACLRYVPADLPSEDPDAREAYLDLLNERLMIEIQLDGRVYCSNAVLDDTFCLRACIVNFRTEAEDMDALLDVAAELGAGLDASLRPPSLH